MGRGGGGGGSTRAQTNTDFTDKNTYKFKGSTWHLLNSVFHYEQFADNQNNPERKYNYWPAFSTAPRLQLFIYFKGTTLPLCYQLRGNFFFLLSDEKTILALCHQLVGKRPPLLHAESKTLPLCCQLREKTLPL